MALHLEESRVVCNKCGNNLLTIYKIIENAPDEYEDVFCKFCDKKKFAEVIVNTKKYTQLTNENSQTPQAPTKNY